jgi:hypothetical protein
VDGRQILFFVSRKEGGSTRVKSTTSSPVAPGVAEHSQQDVRRIHHDPPSPDPLDVPAHDGQETVDVEIAGDNFLSVQPGLD